MAVSEQELRTLLGELVRRPQPPSTIDVGRAVRDGRRRRRTRRFLEGGAVVAATGLVLGGVGLLGGEKPQPVTVVAPKRFDPMTRYAEFGWRPPRLGERTVDIRPEQLVLTAGAPGSGRSTRPASRLAVVLYPAGVRPPANVVESLPWPLEGTCRSDDGAAAPLIGGRPARWTYPRVIGRERCDPTALELRWQYAPGAWAVARTARLAPADGDPRAVLRRVAETLRAGANEPVRTPFRAGFLPRDMQVSGSLERGVPGTNGWSLSFRIEGRDGKGRRTVAIAVTPMGSLVRTGGNEPLDTTVDGHRAHRRTRDYGGMKEEILRVVDVHGFEFWIRTTGVGHRAPERILRGLTVLGADPAAWTSRPFG